MNTINFQQIGGFPLETNTLTEVQKAYSIFNTYGTLAGDYTIISGCNEEGSEISNGFIYLDGELLEFKSGIKQSTIVVIQEETTVEFEDRTEKATYFTRYARFGSGINSIEWAKFKRFSPLTALTEKINTLETKLSKVVPVGLVAVWDRPADQIPEGWVEHTDMAGYAPVGFKKADSDFNVLGKVLGEKKHKLTKDEMPSHDHDYVASGGHWAVVPRGGNDNLRALPPGGKKTAPTGGDKAHNNIQPSRIVRFIRFVGIN